jgi:hypothetical protein
MAGWVSLLSFGATIAYFAQANIVSATIHGAAAQTRLSAGIDLAVGPLSLATQVFATATFLKRFGTGIAAAALPVTYVAGFAALAVAPSLSVVVTLQVAQRWMNFAIANPARQLFFTVVGREEKYKAKNLIDVVIYRGSDAFYGWVYDSLGLKLGAIAVCACRWRRAGSSSPPRWGERRSALRRKQMTKERPMAIRMKSQMTRRAFGVLAGTLLLTTKLVAQTEKTEAPPLSRPIPGSCERIPAVGLGTAYVFDVNNDVTRSKADAVIQARGKSAGRLMDTASTYGDAESVLGEVTAAAGLRDKRFVATKLEAPDAQELKR